MRFSEVLDCIGPFFSREWDELYDVLAAANDDDRLRKRRRRRPSRCELGGGGGGVGGAADRAAAGVLARWSNRSFALLATFPAVLHGGADVRSLQGFCSHGFCAALQRAAVAAAAAGDGEAFMEERRACATWAGEGWTWRFLSETRWASTLSPLQLLGLDRPTPLRRLASAGAASADRSCAAAPMAASAADLWQRWRVGRRRRRRRLAGGADSEASTSSSSSSSAFAAAALSGACPSVARLLHGRCWALSRPGEACAPTCKEMGLPFSAVRVSRRDPVLPKLLGRTPRWRRPPLARVECFDEGEDALHAAFHSKSAAHCDDGHAEDWSLSSCRLACPCLVPLSPSSSADVPSSDRYLAEYRTQLLAAMEATLHPLGGGVALRPWTLAPKPGFARSILISAFGVHLTTLLEPIAAFRKVLPEALDLRTVFYGATHPPPEPIIGEVCPAEGEYANPNFMCYSSVWPGDAFWMQLVDRPSLREGLDALATAIENDDGILQSDMLLCGGGHAPVLCMMLRMVSDKPMFFNLQAPLAFRMAQDPDKRAALTSFFREMSRPGLPTSPSWVGRTVMSTSLIFFQRQFWVQTGRLLPIVRNHNLYAAKFLGVGPAGAGTSMLPRREVIFWQNHISLKPDCAVTVWRFLKQTVLERYPAEVLPYNLVFKNINRLPSWEHGRRIYALNKHESMTLSFGEMFRRFSAAVLFPHDLGMISFDDLYALTVPLFLPSDELIVAMAYVQLSTSKNYPWYLLREEHADLEIVRPASEMQEMPWDPGWGGAAAIATSEGRAVYCGRGVLEFDKLAAAVAVSNFALLPHVRRFDSLVHLLDRLRGLSPEELASTSLAMRRSSEEAWAVTAEFYRRAAGQLLAGVDVAATT